MGTLLFKGDIEVRPQQVSETSFPGGRADIILRLTPSPKPENVHTGVQLRDVNTLVYVVLSGLGSSDSVTQANFLYVRTNAPMLLRLTFEDGASPDIVSVVPINGVYILEVDQNRYLKLLEVLGQGKIEWFVSGLQ
jgi:hypothetical protein